VNQEDSEQNEVDGMKKGADLSVMFVHCAQTVEDINKISFAYDSTMSLPDRVKI